MTKDITTRKPAEKYLPERFSCALCGTDRIYNGIVFKGSCICEECIAYLSSVNPTGDKASDDKTSARHTANSKLAAEGSARGRKRKIPEIHAAENRDGYRTETGILKD